MPFKKLTAADLKTSSRGAARRSPYTLFVGGLRVGEGGRGLVAEEGVSRQHIKNRLKTAAQDVGVTIAFMRSAPEEVVFRVVSRKTSSSPAAEASTPALAPEVAS